MSSSRIWWTKGRFLGLGYLNDNNTISGMSTLGSKVRMEHRYFPVIGADLDEELDMPEDVALAVVSGVLSDLGVADAQIHEARYMRKKMELTQRHSELDNSSGVLAYHGTIR
jgi:hypothetical protein